MKDQNVWVELISEPYSLLKNKSGISLSKNKNDGREKKTQNKNISFLFLKLNVYFKYISLGYSVQTFSCNQFTNSCLGFHSMTYILFGSVYNVTVFVTTGTLKL